jgi:hypothetical protein
MKLEILEAAENELNEAVAYSIRKSKPACRVGVKMI